MDGDPAIDVVGTAIPAGSHLSERLVGNDVAAVDGFSKCHRARLPDCFEAVAGDPTGHEVAVGAITEGVDD
ncbi:hypothetical protein I7X12_07045 [Halosimplex litoreum]|uniref:Uncharacterized protein n=1 Tax=Halosimplex litoreum TaxID=1198301 RepID=A0A7T3KWR8_9EURY|nr:hypothetical protein [Halosimplex litoreum]QPV64363.1 hypothetical protein I7X12_07045 [Halosimplex litoreum]